MKLFAFFILFSLLQLSFQSLADEKSDKLGQGQLEADLKTAAQASKVQVTNTNGLNGPTQKFNSLEELLAALREQDGSACTLSLMTNESLNDAYKETKAFFKDLPTEQQNQIAKYISFDSQKLAMMLKVVSGITEKERLELLNELIPMLQGLRKDLLPVVFYQVQENPSLFITAIQHLVARIKAGTLTADDHLFIYERPRDKKTVN